MAALGVVMAIVERNKTGKGQVVEIDMVSCTLKCKLG